MSIDEEWDPAAARPPRGPEPPMRLAAAAGAAHPTWEAGKASSACVGAWQQRLRELSDPSRPSDPAAAAGAAGTD